MHISLGRCRRIGKRKQGGLGLGLQGVKLRASEIELELALAFVPLQSQTAGFYTRPRSLGDALINCEYHA